MEMKTSTFGNSKKVFFILLCLLFIIVILFLCQYSVFTGASLHWCSAIAAGAPSSARFFIVHRHLKASVDLLPELLRLRLSQLEAELQEKTERLSKELSRVTHENADLKQKIQSNG